MNEKAIIYEQFSVGEVGNPPHHLSKNIQESFFIANLNLPRFFSRAAVYPQE
jgi:hypothetical protein